MPTERPSRRQPRHAGRRAGGIALSVLCCLGAAAAARAQGLTPELALDLSAVTEAVLSPDGATVAYRLERPPREGEPRLRIGELRTVAAAGGPARRPVQADAPVRQLRWSPDGRRLAWIAAPAGTEASQIHVLDRPGSADAVRVLTDAGAVEAFEWSPDGARIAYAAEDAPTGEETRALAEGRDGYVFDRTARPRRLYVLALAGGSPRRLSAGDASVQHFAWSPDGRRLAYAASPTATADDMQMHTQPYLVEAAGGAPSQLAQRAGPLAHPAWTADGRWIAWLGAVGPTDPWHGSVFAVPAAGGASVRNLTPDYGGTTTWLGALPGRSNRLVFLAEERQATVLRSIDPATGAIQVLSAPEAVFAGAPSFAADGRRFAVVASTPAHPAEVFVGSLDRPAALQRLTRSNPQLEGIALGQQEVVRWRSRDGLDIEGILIKPVGYRSGVRYPVVVHVHGGSEGIVSQGWHGSYIDWGQPLAARGYAVVYPNYRGSRGRGVDFVSGNRRDLMGREWEDIESALDHAIELGIGDPRRAGIYGFSWGGYAAGWGATYASHRFRAAVGGAGIYNWISEAGSNDTRMHEQIAHWDAPLYEHFNLYLERSPIYEVRKADTPLLMLHGERDEACPVGQAIEMHTALKWKGVPVELVIYPREGHGMRELPHQRDFLTRGLAWFDRYLGPAAGH